MTMILTEAKRTWCILKGTCLKPSSPSFSISFRLTDQNWSNLSETHTSRSPMSPQWFHAWVFPFINPFSAGNKLTGQPSRVLTDTYFNMIVTVTFCPYNMSQNLYSNKRASVLTNQSALLKSKQCLFHSGHILNLGGFIHTVLQLFRNPKFRSNWSFYTCHCNTTTTDITLQPQIKALNSDTENLLVTG